MNFYAIHFYTTIINIDMNKVRGKNGQNIKRQLYKH